MDKVYCDGCKHCRRDNSLLTSFWGLDKTNAMKYAKCLASPKEALSDKHSKVTEGTERDGFYYCSTINDDNDCPKFEAKIG